jgi:uncharacterized membrane protein YgcG
MLRLSLESVVLKVKMLGIRTDAAIAEAAARGIPLSGGADGAPPSIPLRGIPVLSAKAILAQSLQAPDTSNVDAALVRLAALGALASSDDTADVTPFGRMLASFPGDLALGRLVAFGAVLGALPDAIVMAASLAVTDVFLLPHAAVAASPVDFAANILKVTRSRWLFGRDATLAALSEDASGASLHGWSEPLLARNAYIAWRGVHPATRRPGWASSLGLMHKRLAAVHSMVREIGHRVANDMPGFRDVIATLLHDGPRGAGPRGVGGGRGGGGGAPRGGGGGGGGGSAGGEPGGGGGGGSWPPPGLFSSDTHLLRLLLVSALASNLCIGSSSPRKVVVKAMASGGLNPQRAIAFNATSLPPAWAASLASFVPDSRPGAAPGRDAL